MNGVFETNLDLLL